MGLFLCSELVFLVALSFNLVQRGSRKVGELTGYVTTRSFFGTCGGQSVV